MKCFVISLIFIGFFGTVYAAPESVRDRAYERADFVFYGEVLSLDVLSESSRTIENDNYVDLAGKAVYSIKIHNFIKNSFDDEVISAYGFYYLEKPSGTSPGLYKIGDKIEFYIQIFNENESSYEYLIDYAEVVKDSCPVLHFLNYAWEDCGSIFTWSILGIPLLVIIAAPIVSISAFVIWRIRN